MKFPLSQCQELIAGKTYYFTFRRGSDASGLGGYISKFRNYDQFFYSSYWGFRFGFGGWTEESLKEWSLKLEGNEKTLEPVIIVPGILGSSEKNGAWVIDPILHTYDDLIATLKANGYVEGKNLFTFPYDWRVSNSLTALKLRDKINGVKAICQCQKVDIVAHSMGGLVAQQYIESGNYQNDVDQLIFVGTPHSGAPSAYSMWEGGTAGVEFNIEDLLLNVFLRQYAYEAGFGNSKPLEVLFNYIHSSSSPILSVQELLPVYDYLKDYDTEILRNYPNGYPRNAFLENLDASSSLALLEQSGINITNIFSDSQSNTITSLKIKNDSSTLPLWSDGVPQVIERGIGDGTVPAESAKLNVSNGTNVDVVGVHNKLPTNAENKIFEILTGSPPATIITTSPIKKILSFFGLSPIDILITAPDGKRIGNENIFIPYPLDGEYKITTQGTADGSYTVLVNYIREELSGEATSTVASFSANTAAGKITDLNLSFNSATPQNIEVRPADTVPPSIQIASPQSKDYLRSEILPISVSITDAESGVFSQEIKFDDRIVNSGESIDLFFEKLGSHKLSANAVDFVGNSASAEIQFRIIATLQSTISDIERAYSLGWIVKKSVKNTLVKKLENLDAHNKPLTQKTLKTFLAELEREHPKNINDSAYNLLKEDIDWLLNN